MGKHLFGISTLIMSIALLIWSIGETFAFPQGPNVSLGSNPIVTLDCGDTTTSEDIPGYPTFSNPYEVPAGFYYIITDLGSDNGGDTLIMVNNGNGWKTIFSHSNSSSKPQGFSLQTGMKVPSGAFVRCFGSYQHTDGFVSGYLAHQ